ncbi:MAG: hypothetical protein ABSB59_31275 [Streptosporangiaceae bacterium]
MTLTVHPSPDHSLMFIACGLIVRPLAAWFPGPAKAAQPIVIPQQIRPSESNQLIRLPPSPTATPTWADEIFGKRRVTLE